MNPDQWRRIQQLFDAAVEIKPGERSAFLEQEASTDVELRREVTKLLSSHEKAGDFLRQPVVRSASLDVGEVIANRYRIISLIGRGGMGEVYQAKDQFLHENIAIKKLRDDLSGNDFVARQFQREIQLARKVTHASVCRVFEVGIHERPNIPGSRMLFFTMEFLRGETLLSKIRREGRLSREAAFPIAVQMADGLAAAHKAGVIHTDFKSGNIILVPSPSGGERAVITDFGLARRDPAMLTPEVTRTMFPDGQMAGTVAYMSPEQLSGGTITPASDIYSFGIVLFEMATGQLPFDDRHVIHSAMQRADAHPVSIRSLVPDIDARWEEAINRCLQNDPQRRFGSAAELAGWLRGSFWSPRTWTRREWIRAGSAGVISVAGGSGVWIWLSQPYSPPLAALEWYEKGRRAMHSMTYEAARRSFEQAITADSLFALAHANLARSYDEMDYSDRAKDSMLRAVAAAQEARLGNSDERMLRALQFMISREYDRAAPLLRQLEDELEGQDKAAAALEFGWLAQLRDDTDSAEAAYNRAVKLAPNYAAAKLRLGFILGRRGGKDDLAFQAFADAEKLYSASSDYEGITETLYNRALLLNRRSRPREAMPIIDRAIDVARTVGAPYQEIRLKFLQVAVIRKLGQAERATDLARKAIDAAEVETMDNLASNGLLELGNTYFTRGDLNNAEQNFRRALTLARRGKVRRFEARARASLASICEQDHRPEEGRQLAEEALKFYRQAGYRRESMQMLGVIAGLLHQLGQYEEGARTAREALEGWLQLKDSKGEALARERLGRNLRGSGSWAEALDEYRRAAELLKPDNQREPDNEASAARLDCAQLSLWLGRRQDAMKFLDQVRQALEKDANQQILATLRAREAEMAYDDGHWNDTLVLAKQGLSTKSRGDETAWALSLFQALALIRTKRSVEATELSANLIRELEQEKQVGTAPSVRLALAEAWLAVDNRNVAQQLVRDAVDYFESHQVLESTWRAHALAALTSADSEDMETHRKKAGAALAQLKTRFPAESFQSYLQRPDIKRLSESFHF